MLSFYHGVVVIDPAAETDFTIEVRDLDAEPVVYVIDLREFPRKT